jgi:hypothetical protein
MDSFANGSIACEIWAGFGSSGATGVVSFSGTGTACSANLSEWSGLTGLDVTGHSADTSTTLHASLTTTFANDLIILAAGTASADTITAQSGWTLLTQDATAMGTLGAEYQIESAIGTYSPQLTDNNNIAWAAVVAAFKGSAPLLGEDSYVTGRRVDQDLWRTAYVYG